MMKMLRVGMICLALMMVCVGSLHSQPRAPRMITLETVPRVAQVANLQIPGATHMEWSPLPDRQTLAVATSSGVLLYSVADILAGTATPNRLQDDGRPAQDLAFSANGQMLAVAAGSTVRIYDVGTLSELSSLQGTAPIAFSPDNGDLLYASGSEVRIFDMSLRVERGALVGHTDRINDVVFSSDGGLIASASQDMTLRYWSAERAVQVGLSRSRRNPIIALDISPNGALIASGTRSSVVRLLNLAVDIERTYRPLSTRGAVTSVDFSADGSLLLFTIGTTVRLLDPGARTEVLILNDHSASVLQARFNPDGSLFATIGLDGALYIYGLV